MKKVISYTLLASILFNLSACGTFLYPERKGQKGGRLDPSIVILDGIALLFFVIPGVIAYAVDYNNGTIFIPDTDKRNVGKRTSFDLKDMRPVPYDKRYLNDQSAARFVSKQTGIDFDPSKAKVYKHDYYGAAPMVKEAQSYRYLPK